MYLFTPIDIFKFASLNFLDFYYSNQPLMQTATYMLYCNAKVSLALRLPTYTLS